MDADTTAPAASLLVVSLQHDVADDLLLLITAMTCHPTVFWAVLVVLSAMIQFCRHAEIILSSYLQGNSRANTAMYNTRLISNIPVS
jgi:hypothetical protein